MRDGRPPLAVPRISLEIDPSTVRAPRTGWVSAPPPWGRWSVCFLSWRFLLMALSWLRRLLKRKSGPVSRAGRKKPGHGRFVPAVELLAERILPAVTATFLPSAGTLSIFGDAQDNTITVSRDAAGQILV